MKQKARHRKGVGNWSRGRPWAGARRKAAGLSRGRRLGNL